jgi:wyosine [tRNA(Phe)-imidazoG37] synthetase (radical SAM superfamily)
VRARDRPLEPVLAQPILVFGPIPSRRLGRSLGVNNIPSKICSYGCVYCQVGATPSPQLDPRRIYPPDRLVRAVAAQVAHVRARGERIDHLTFAPDGEPTLDVNLGRAIEGLRPLGIPVAVITNASLTWRPEVRAALRLADWVSVKVDAVREDAWRRVNRPPAGLSLSSVLEGIRALVDGFPGRLVSETMLVDGVNDDLESVTRVARFLGETGISTSYVSIPTRPPAEPGVRGPGEAVVARARRILSERVARVECLVDYEGDDFGSSGDARADLLAITAVHPMRDSAVRELLVRDGCGWELVDALVRDGLLDIVEHAGARFVVRRPRAGGSRTLR